MKQSILMMVALAASRHYGLSKSIYMLVTVDEHLAAREEKLDAKATASIP